jgi:hypothetical protein
MAKGVTFKVNKSEFTRTLNEYKKLSRRDPAVIVNTKAFYILRRAVVETPKADKAAISAELRGSRMKDVTLKNGRVRRTKYTLAQLIIIARRAAKGLPTSKAAIKEEVEKFTKARLKSIAFIKAGFLPGVKVFEPLAAKIGGAPPRMTKSNSGTQYGAAKGSGTPASEGSARAVAKFVNDALPKSRGSAGLLSRIIHSIHNPSRAEVLAVAEPALQRAFDAETASMKEYIEKKQRQTAERAGVKTK